MGIETRVTARLGIDYPIIQGPLGGLSSQRLTAEVSEFGGLGSFGALSLEPSALTDVIAEIRALTSRPFVVNLWVSTEDPEARTTDAAAFARSLAPLADHITALGGTSPQFTPPAPVRFEDQARAALEAGVPVLSFIFGIPPHEILDECRARGTVTMGAATTPDEARALADAGIDIVVASGFEAGGHRGAFLRPASESLMGTFSLVPRVADAVTVPVVAAGGIGDARGIVAAFALGAEGVQIGTAFLTCAGSGASATHQAALRSGQASQTALTSAFTGRLARGIQNRLMEELSTPDVPILPYPLQRTLVRSLTTLAEPAGRTDLLPLWAGQSADLSHPTDATSFLQSLIAEISTIAGPVLHWQSARESSGPH